MTLKLRCDECFTHAFTACGCVFKEITLVGSNQGNYFENATACRKRTLKTTVATQLKGLFTHTVSTLFDACIINFNRNFPIENATHSAAFLPWFEVMNLGLAQTACK